ncbi:MAG: hypothetical protein CVU44_17310 [Chloroflexi bacterium HGW-Chloroflexi-6]|nr:MAG: hypothetical protein CVU44_17310 [Chloroflexi bacterium HGW-Chloroflexi-6]
MSANAFQKLEEIYPEIVNLMEDEFNSHEFILKLAQKYQKNYVQALIEYAENDQPFQSVHSEIAKRLKKREDLVKHIDSKPSVNIFGLKSEAAIWRKVK